ncbi:MAG: multidrug effflux MFS transporter [Rubricella sp.]
MTAPASHAPMSYTAFVAFTAALFGMNALAIDIMLPGLPAIAEAYALSDPNRAQAIITAYLIGFGVGQIFIGVLADRFGRRPVLLIGLVIYGIAALVCVIAPTLETLLLARLIQGLGSAAPRIVSMAVVRDCYEGRAMARVASLALTIFMAVPVFAPLIGQAMLFAVSWQAIFALLAIYAGAVFLYAIRRLPETLPAAHRRPIRWTTIREALGSILASRQTVGYTLAAGTFFGALFGFVNSAQQVLAEALALGNAFTLVFAGVGLSIALAAFANAQLVERLGMRLLSHAAVILYTALSGALVLIERGGGLSAPLFIVALFLIMLLVGLVFSNFNAMAMEPQGHVAGMASSFVGAGGVLIGATFGHVIGQAYDGTAGPLLTGFLVCGSITLLLILYAERGRLFRAGPA